MSTASAPVLVIGATGQQGGAAARALLADDVPVRALVREPATDRAKAVEALGATLVTGDLNDPDSLIEATGGARAVFSVQMPAVTADGIDFDGEVAQATNLIEAARATEVPQFVHTSVTGAGQHTELPSWAEGRWPIEATLTAKTKVQDLVRSAGFPHWTILKPGTFMENFQPSRAFMFPRGVQGGIVSVLNPSTRLSLIAVNDIGKAAAAAITAPERFHGVELELAGDHLSMTEIAAIVSHALGTHLPAPEMTADEALDAGMPAPLVAHEWLNVAGQPGRPQYARELGIEVTEFASWARTHLLRDS